MAARTTNLQSRETGAALPLMLFGGLAVVSLFELLVLRTFTRTAIHIPALEQLAGPYRVIAFAGRYAYFVSLVLLIAALPASALALWRAPARLARAASGAVAAFLVAAGAATTGLSGNVPIGIVTVSAVVVMAGIVADSGGRTMAPAIALYAAAFALSGAHTVTQALIQEGARPVDARWLLTGGEVFGVCFALASPLLVGERLHRGAAIVALAAGLVTFGLLLGGGGSTARILLLWNEGLSGTLPSAAYALAAAALAATLFALVRSGQQVRAVGLLLLVTGGLGLHSTYQSGLVLTGLAALLLTAGAPRQEAAETPATERAGTPGVPRSGARG